MPTRNNSQYQYQFLSELPQSLLDSLASYRESIHQDNREVITSYYLLERYNSLSYRNITYAIDSTLITTDDFKGANILGYLLVHTYHTKDYIYILCHSNYTINLADSLLGNIIILGKANSNGWNILRIKVGA